MQSKRGVLLALHNMLETQPNQPTIEWVKSHQDDDDTGKKLALGALLNIEADKLATEGLKSGHKKEKIAMDPNAQVQVHKDTSSKQFKNNKNSTLYKILHGYIQIE